MIANLADSNFGGRARVTVEQHAHAIHEQFARLVLGHVLLPCLAHERKRHVCAEPSRHKIVLVHSAVEISGAQVPLVVTEAANDDAT